jgi:hypothetical protein
MHGKTTIKFKILYLISEVHYMFHTDADTAEYFALVE